MLKSGAAVMYLKVVASHETIQNNNKHHVSLISLILQHVVCVVILLVLW